MKKSAIFITATIMLIVCLAFSAFAGDIDTDFPVYTAGENNALTWKTDNSVLFISGKDNMNEFCIWGSSDEHPEWLNTMTNAPWRDVRNQIKTIVIGEGVKTVGWFAFYGFKNLQTVYIPKTVKDIQPGAFGNCPKLKNVYFSGTKDEMDELWVEDTSSGNKAFADAKWTFSTPYVDGYTITYVLSGGKNSSKNPSSYKSGAAITLYAPSRTGYTFGGWYTDSSYKTQIKSISSTAKKNYKLYAKWKANKYTVRFNGNGATSGSLSALSCTYNTKYTLPANTFVKPNYTFTSWNTKKDGKGKSYKNKASIKNLSSKDGSVITLYAQWKKTEYIIVFNGNGAVSGTMTSITAKLGTAYTLSSNKFKRPCYTFTGWNTKKDGKGTAYKDKATVKNLTKKDGEKVTLYAQWKLNKSCYTITYKLNGGKNNAEAPLAYSSKSTASLSKPTKTGYTFAGWYTESSYKHKVTAIKAGSNGNKVLYAKWNANKYSVVFNGNGATSGNMKSMVCVYDKSYTLTANSFKNSGVGFSGWNTKADGSGASYKNKEKIKNLKAENNAKITLYAQWSKVIHSGTENQIKWKIYDNGLLSLTKGSGTIMTNYILLTNYTMFGSFSQSTAPWASRGTGTRELVYKASIGNGIENIGRYAFSYCFNMTEITIPSSVVFIGSGAFLGCSDLKDVYFDGTKQQWEKINIESGNTCLTEAKIHFSK